MQGVPHRGWTCTAMDDREDDLQPCEMCESAEVRYVHYMEHSDYPDVLAVGCVCAEHMEQDYEQPRERERALRGQARRRKSWRKRTWRISARGNAYLNTDGYNLVLISEKAGWRITVTNRLTGASRAGKKIFSSEAEVKDAAFGALIWAKGRL